MGRPKFLACLVILCFEKRHPKQSTVARLKSSVLASPKRFWADYTTDVQHNQVSFKASRSFCGKPVFVNP